MKKHFSEFYKPTRKKIKQLWEKSLFVFDTNVLLDLYRFSKITSDLFFEILEKLKSKNQLWIPYQTGFEFHKNRVEVIDMISGEYGRLHSYFSEELSEQVKKIFYKNCHSHPFINSGKYLKIVNKIAIKISKEIKSLELKHPNLIKTDQILIKVTKLFDGRVGNSYNQEELKEVFRTGEERYSKLIPPGYSDSKKTEPERFGDLVFWFQIIDNAKVTKKPVILITRDTKPDWWNFHKGEKDGARKELIKEIRNKAGVDFHIYEINNFISLAAKELKVKVTSKSKKEIEVSARDQREISNIGTAEGYNNIGSIVTESSGIVASFIGKDSLISQPIIEKKEKLSKQIK